jgi:hypothetical protein
MSHLIKLKFNENNEDSFYFPCLPYLEFDEGEFKITIGSYGGYWPISTMKYRLENTFGEWK